MEPEPTTTETTEIDTTQHDHARTRARQGAFLAAFAKSCSIGAAAKATEIDRTTHYLWLKRDPEYVLLFEEAKQLAHQVLKDSAVEKAIVGWDEPVFHEGKQCGAIRKRSDTLHLALLKAAYRNEFSDRAEITGAEGAPLINSIRVEFVAPPEQPDESQG